MASTMTKIGIIDCGMGNLTSVKNSFLRAGVECDFINDAHRVCDYEKIVLPGVGSFPVMMKKLEQGKFIESILNHHTNDKPIMGICLGMQALFERSEEFENTFGLSILNGSVIALPRGKHPVPNVGWWDLRGNMRAFSSELNDTDTFYFVHSFYCNPEIDYDSMFIELNGKKVLVAVKHENVFGYQFHPEKSQKSGQKILKAFIDL